MKVYAPALWVGLGLIIILLVVKMATKIVGIWPLTRLFRMGLREGNYTTLLMCTGLTFGTISALFGLNNGYIDKNQYSIPVTVVIGSAVVPTMIAQAFFRPEIEPAVAQEIRAPAELKSSPVGTDGSGIKASSPSSIPTEV